MKYPTSYYWHMFRGWIRRKGMRLAERLFGGARFDPIAEAAAGSETMTIRANPCTDEWTIEFKGPSGHDGKDRDATYTIYEVHELTQGGGVQEAIRKVCWDHCYTHSLPPC